MKLTKLSILTSTIGVSVLGYQNIAGHLVAKVGMNEGAALAAIAALTSGGAVMLEAAWPMLVPFLGTIQFLVATVGVGAAVGF
ncbi:hypothetical protein QUV80_02130 [Paraclostridium benzoelyticum]|nr:hypothetical protein [Paraclostridium benzoelyticum]